MSPLRGLWTEPLAGHVQKRMRQRKISTSDLAAVLDGGTAHHLSVPGDRGGTCYIGRVGERELKVWTMPHQLGKRPVTIKSAAWRDSEDE